MSPLKRRPFRTFGRWLVAATASVGLLLSTFSVAPVLADDGSSKDTSAKASDTSTKSDSKDGVNRDAWRKLQTMMNRRTSDRRGPGARPNAQNQWRGRYRTQMAGGYHRHSPAGPAWAHNQHRHHGAQFARYHHRHHGQQMARHHRGGQQFARNHRGGPQWARNTYRHGSAWARMNFGRGHGSSRFAQARYHSRHGHSAWARSDFNRGRSGHHRGGQQYAHHNHRGHNGQQFARHNHRGHNGRGMGAGGPQFAGRGPHGNFGQGGFGPQGYLAQRGFAPRGGFGFGGSSFGQGFGSGFGGAPGQRGFGPGPGAAFAQRGFASGPGQRFADRNFGPPNGRMAGFNRNHDGAQDVSKLEARIDGLEHRIDALLDQLAKLQPASAQK